MHKLKPAAFDEVVAKLVPAANARDDRNPAAAEGLHVCHACASALVYPTEWEEAGDDAWQVALRCPNCEWSGSRRLGQKHLDQLERELDRGDAELEADLAQLTRANMADEIDRFIGALDADAIQPFDF